VGGEGEGESLADAQEAVEVNDTRVESSADECCGADRVASIACAVVSAVLGHIERFGRRRGRR
jgi:hypothetical protein